MPPDNDIPESTYPLLMKPTFKSQIPEPLLAQATPQEQYILNQLSILSQYAHWSMGVLAETNLQTRRTNGRLLKAESDIASLQESKQHVLWSGKTVMKMVGVVVGIVSFIYMLVGIASCSPVR